MLEVWANQKTLVSFDGRVLELFAIPFEMGNAGLDAEQWPQFEPLLAQVRAAVSPR
jgi:hypothetical protein